MALVSSNSLVVPLQTEFFALEGLTQLMKTIERIKTSKQKAQDTNDIELNGDEKITEQKSDLLDKSISKNLG